MWYNYPHALICVGSQENSDCFLFLCFVFFFCLSFQVGDLVLIILDEIHDNYVLFTVGPTLYFLHSESLTALDLKPGEAQHLVTVARAVRLHEDAHRQHELRERRQYKSL